MWPPDELQWLYIMHLGSVRSQCLRRLLFLDYIVIHRHLDVEEIGPTVVMEILGVNQRTAIDYLYTLREFRT